MGYPSVGVSDNLIYAMMGENSTHETTRLHVLVTGEVQGVSFRSHARRHAQRLRLVGWARNWHDGSTVELMAEGPRPALEQLLQYLHTGPYGARVVQVNAEWGVAEGEFESFRIL